MEREGAGAHANGCTGGEAEQGWRDTPQRAPCGAPATGRGSTGRPPRTPAASGWRRPGRSSTRPQWFCRQQGEAVFSEGSTQVTANSGEASDMKYTALQVKLYDVLNLVSTRGAASSGLTSKANCIARVTQSVLQSANKLYSSDLGPSVLPQIRVVGQAIPQNSFPIIRRCQSVRSLVELAMQCPTQLECRLPQPHSDAVVEDGLLTASLFRSFNRHELQPNNNLKDRTAARAQNGAVRGKSGAGGQEAPESSVVDVAQVPGLQPIPKGRVLHRVAPQPHRLLCHNQHPVPPPTIRRC